MNSVITLLRLLIVHLAISAFIYRKILNLNDYKRFFKKKWVYISSVFYSIFVFAAFSLWNKVWLIPCYIFLFIAICFAVSLIKSNIIKIVLSQIFLLLILIATWIYLTEFNSILILHSLQDIFNSKNILLIIFGFLILIWPSGYLIGLLTEPFRMQLEDKEVSKGLEKAGLWIGIIERTIIYIFILTNSLTAIAFLITAKSIFRFGELRKPGNRKEAEYILIGTLISYSNAMIIGFLIKLFL